MEHVDEHTSADAQYEATPAGAGYEHTDANVWIIVKFFFWLAVAAAIIHVGLAMLFGLFVEQRVERTAPRYPLAATEGERLPPEPRLQRFPRQDILQFRLGEESALTTYGWVDQKAGTVHIPILDAMRLTLERGLPSRPPAGTQITDPDLIPSDSSAGRTFERRR
jgi:hypothetical protein